MSPFASMPRAARHLSERPVIRFVRLIRGIVLRGENPGRMSGVIYTLFVSAAALTIAIRRFKKRRR